MSRSFKTDTSIIDADMPAPPSAWHHGGPRLSAAAPATAQLKRMGLQAPDAFPASLGRIPNNPVIAAVTAAILKGGPGAQTVSDGWKPARDGSLIYRHSGSRGGEIVVRFDIDGRSLAQQWADVEAMSPLTLDLFFIVLAQLSETSVLSKTGAPAAEAVIISCIQLFKYKALTRWGEERAAIRGRIETELERIARLCLDIREFPAWDPSRRAWNHGGISRLGDRVLRLEPVTPKDEAQNPQGYRFWRAAFGGWSQHWMNLQGKAWLSPLPLAQIRLDHRRSRGAQVLAKKIAANALLLLGALRTRSHLDRRVDQLLEAIGELPRTEHRPGHWAGRTLDRLAEAMFLLDERGILNISYHHGLKLPESLERKKGWVAQWLSATLLIERPDYMRTNRKSGAGQEE